MKRAGRIYFIIRAENGTREILWCEKIAPEEKEKVSIALNLPQKSLACSGCFWRAACRFAKVFFLGSGWSVFLF